MEASPSIVRSELGACGIMFQMRNCMYSSSTRVYHVINLDITANIMKLSLLYIIVI